MNLKQRHYADSHLREVIRKWLSDTDNSYRSAADLMDVDHAQLNRMVRGEMPVSKKVAKYLGYELAETRWVAVRGSGGGSIK